jgi:hypothetical protein
MSSELKLNFEDSIEVVDRLDGLSCYHYTDATVLSENNIKENMIFYRNGIKSILIY